MLATGSVEVSAPNLPALRTVKLDYGFSEAAVNLNRKFDPASPLLIVTLDIQWEEQDTYSSISLLEETLMGFSPTFEKHECRGEQIYHVFLGAGRPYPAPPEGSAAADDGSTAGLEPFDGRLALAHLIEHAIIDFQCAITHRRRCSGVTAAYRQLAGRFDVIVECANRRLGMVCLSLAVSWLTSALGGKTLGAAEKEVLTVARLAHNRRGVLTPPAIARVLGWSEPRAQRALSALRDAGYLDQASYTLNFSGIPEYQVSGD